jgi:hypothetical protein
MKRGKAEKTSIWIALEIIEKSIEWKEVQILNYKL